LILRKIIKIVATRCQILRLKCIKFDFGWGSAPDPARGAYSAPPDPLAGFEGPISKGGEGKRGADERGVEGEGRGGEGRGEGREKKGGGGLSVNVAEEAFCLKSAPVVATEYNSYRRQAAESSSFFFLQLFLGFVLMNGACGRSRTHYVK